MGTYRGRGLWPPEFGGHIFTGNPDFSPPNNRWYETTVKRNGQGTVWVATSFRKPSWRPFITVFPPTIAFVPKHKEPQPLSSRPSLVRIAAMDRCSVEDIQLMEQLLSFPDFQWDNGSKTAPNCLKAYACTKITFNRPNVGWIQVHSPRSRTSNSAGEGSAGASPNFCVSIRLLPHAMPRFLMKRIYNVYIFPTLLVVKTMTIISSYNYMQLEETAFIDVWTERWWLGK